MKNLILLIVVLILIGCSRNKKEQNNYIINIDSIANSTENGILKEDSLDEEYIILVQNFINSIKNGKEEVAKLTAYPLSRKYPIPSINNEKELLKRYDEVFDDSLINMIISSNPIHDWSCVGWRGIMLNYGDLWLNHDGKLVAVNYQSKSEQDIRHNLIETERESLHESIRNFDNPILVAKTKQYRIRIDKLRDYNFRYVSWSIDKNMRDKPDLIIENGKVIIEGSMGNTYYEFKNNDYTYIYDFGYDYYCNQKLTIKKHDKTILSQSIEK